MNGTAAGVEAPWPSLAGHVRPEWVDANGHFNVAFYVLAFDLATDAFYDHLGCGAAYRAHSGYSSFTLEGHITWEAELLPEAPFRVRSWLLGHDARRLHYYHEMTHEESGAIAASHELLAVHIDMNTRRSAPFPAAVAGRLAAVQAVHDRLPRPVRAGRSVSLANRRPG